MIDPSQTIQPPFTATAPGLAILRATAHEAPGAGLLIAGLTVFQRSIKQLGRVSGLRVVVIGNGTLVPPATLPANTEVRPPTPDVDAAIAALVGASAAVGPSNGSRSTATVVIGADVVRRQGDPLNGGVRVIDEDTRRRAEDDIFEDLLRGDLGFIARHINKKISFRITRAWLCKLPITPNQVTLGAALIGVLGCLLISTGSYVAMVAGFVLAQVQSVLDGCDGELARVRFQQTEIGEWLDTLVDDFLNFALVGAMGTGLWRAGYGWITAAAGAITCGMLLLYNLVSYRELVRQGVGGELLKIKWRMVKGVDLKSMMSEKDGKSGARGMSPAVRAFLSLGRRDVFIFSWMILAVVKLLPVALLWAFLIAVSCFGTAVGQLVTRDPDPDPAQEVG